MFFCASFKILTLHKVCQICTTRRIIILSSSAYNYAYFYNYIISVGRLSYSGLTVVEWECFVCQLLIIIIWCTHIIMSPNHVYVLHKLRWRKVYLYRYYYRSDINCMCIQRRRYSMYLYRYLTFSECCIFDKLVRYNERWANGNCRFFTYIPIMTGFLS